jgi:hypothetical protein
MGCPGYAVGNLTLLDIITGDSVRSFLSMFLGFHHRASRFNCLSIERVVTANLLLGSSRKYFS